MLHFNNPDERNLSLTKILGVLMVCLFAFLGWKYVFGPMAKTYKLQTLLQISSG